MEEKVVIETSGISLEGGFWQGTSGPGVVITHPHPLFGGSMDNNVVWTAARAFQSKNWATLRFNFRGVEGSSGSYSQGLGEVEDVKAALEYLRARTPGPYFLVGYSFGAYVAARSLDLGLEVKGAILISPPFAFPNLDFIPENPLIKLIIVGDRDDFCPLAELQARQKSRATSGTTPPPEITVIPGADHFWGGQEERLLQILRDYQW
jgi:hypothetical protein